MPNAAELCLRDQIPQTRSSKAKKSVPVPVPHVAEELNILKQNNFEKNIFLKKKMLPLIV